ncbi:MAG: NAD(P)(+) transhydrogenase (Re/Si-specific) subunit beta, partial [Methylophilaceae bacterium]
MIPINPNITAAVYLIAAVLFILSLKGLSSPKNAGRGNVLGMLGMAIAIVTTLFVGQQLVFSLIFAAII